MAQPETPSEIDVLVQQKARPAPEVCRRRSVKQQRMHEDDIACRRNVFQHLQRDSVMPERSPSRPESRARAARLYAFRIFKAV